MAENVVHIPFKKYSKSNSNREMNEKREFSKKNNTLNDNKKKALKAWHLIIIIASAIVIIAIGIFFILKFVNTNKKDPTDSDLPTEIETTGKNLEKPEEPPEDHPEEPPQQNDIPKTKTQILTKEEAIKAFEPSFKVASKSNKLNQLLMKCFDKKISIFNGLNTSYSYFRKGIFDIYTLNETSSDENDKEFYSTKYSTVITINSQCQDFTGKNNDCELEKYLDLNLNRRRNLERKDEEVDKEKLKKVVLPICIIEHSETNIIFSVKCPETLSSSLKEDIISAFQSIKPEAFKGITEDENIFGTSTEMKDDKIYINSFAKECDDYDGDPTKNQICETNKVIITDKDGNLISINKTSTIEMIQDENNNFYKSKTYLFEDISNTNGDTFNPINYKSNLDIIFNLIEPIMKKENYFTKNTFKDILENLMYDNSNNTTPKIRLLEEVSEHQGVKEENILYKNIYGINLAYSLKNDIGQESGENAKAISNFITGNETNEFSHDESNIKLNETLNQFISVSKAGNILANILFEQLNEPFLNLRDNINENIEILNKFLSFFSLSDVFDSTLAIDGLDKLPYTFVPCSQNLYANFNQINNDIAYSINDHKIILKESISNFLTESHKLLNYIFTNLTEASQILSSKKSKIAEVSSYYLNNTDTSYIDIINKAKEILDNYFIKEKELILPLVNNMLNKFDNESLDSIKSIQSTFDILVDNLDKGNLIINLASVEETKNVITNIYNSKIKVNEIIKNIIEKFNKSIGIQENGYFETEKTINDGNKSYTKISQDAMEIAETLDNNLLIDLTFDNIMTNFRDQFIVLLNNMETSKRQKFPLKENILANSIFTESKMNQIDRDFDTEKVKILNFIKNENKGYLDFINQTLTSFKDENEKNLGLAINNIQGNLSKINLDNLDSKYNESLTLTINSINKIIDNNNNLATQYLTNVKNKNSRYCTQAFINKYNTYLNNLNTIRNYIKNDLKKNLVNKYKSMITNIRELLQSIKSNEVIKKYSNSLPFAETHLKVINDLFSRLDEYISDNLFNKKYLPRINNYITSKINSLNTNEKNIYNLYSQVYRLPYKNSNYDYYLQHKNCWSCCTAWFLWCWSYGTCCNSYYQGYYIDVTNNHLKLQNINLSQYTNQFDILFSNIYTNLKNNINSYNTNMNKLSSPLETKKKEILTTNNDYLNTISQTILTYINNDLGSNLLNHTYNYFKDELSKNLPNELNNILEQWKGVLDKVDDDLNNNISNFKSNIVEFGRFCSFYYQVYKSNITYEYVNSLVEQSKNEMNYTIKYYYNIILSKVNRTYSYILNNIPINDKPFDEILNQRIKEIMDTYNNILNQFQISRNEILTINKQLSILKVNKDNFFSINSIANDNVNTIEEVIPGKCSKIMQTGNQVEINDKEELVIARFYLENSINGKQIIQINEPINRATFIDLQTDVFQNLIDEIYEIDQDELIKNIKNTLKEFNERITKNFKLEKDKYTEIIQEKIYKEYYTKVNLEKKINSFYTNGLINLDTQSKNTIIGYLDQVLNNIKTHISNEANRLADGTYSYSTNYNTIKQTLNNYKNNVYNQFYSAITSLVIDFHNQILNKFYINYIEKYLEELETETQKENFGVHNFLDISFNLSEIINEKVEALINDYKNISKIQIDYLHTKYIQQLDTLFSFSTIKTKINDEITNIFNSKLLPALKTYAIFKPGNTGIEDYDFPNEINNNIDNFINTKINQTKVVINKMKGKNYNINDDEWNIPGFSKLKQEEFKNIKDSFNSFYNIYKSKELEEFKNIVFKNIENNFKIFVNNFVPSFAKDFFDRILKYNEIQKIKSLYYNLKYSLTETLIYYIQLCSVYKSESFPEDLKYKILTLNDLESVVRANNNKVISTLSSKIQEFFENTKNYLVEKYISQMKIDPNINMAFNENIKVYIEQILDGKRYVFEDNYINSINSYIKEPFIKQYSKTLNDESKDMINFIGENKEQARNQFNKLFNLKTHDVLLDIEEKLNNTLNSIKDYNSHFDSFCIPDEVKIYLNNYVLNSIKPIYDQAKSILDSSTRDLIFENLEQNSEAFKNAYSIQDFDSKVNEINYNLTTEFNTINETLKSYGIINSKYEENLEKEKVKYERIRRLDDLDEDKITYSRQAANIKVEESFQKIINSSFEFKKFIDTLNLFNEFEEKLEKYNNSIQYQYSSSQINIQNNNQYYDELNEKLEELYHFSNQYYNKVNNSYYKVKKLIESSAEQINNIIEKCANITYDTLANKYIEIKNKFQAVNETNNEVKDSIPVNDYNAKIEDKKYVIKTEIDSYKKENEFKLDIKFEEGNEKNPKVIGYIKNKNRPKLLYIDLYSKYGQDGRIGRKMVVKLNEIMLNIDINYEAGLNYALINTTLDYDEFEIKTDYYEKKEIITFQNLGGFDFPIIEYNETILDPPENELSKEIIKANKTYINDTYNF